MTRRIHKLECRSNNIHASPRLVVLQVIMPNISFAGHLAGILAGTLQLYGLPIIPNESYLRHIDECSQLRSLTSVPSFVATTSLTIGRNWSANNGSSFDRCHAVTNIFKSIGQTFTVLLFGRGHAANANIRLVRADPETQEDLIHREDDREHSEIV